MSAVSIPLTFSVEEAYAVVNREVVAGNGVAAVAALQAYEKGKRAAVKAAEQAAKAARELPYRRNVAGGVWMKLFQAKKGEHEAGCLNLSKRGAIALRDFVKAGHLDTICDKWDYLPLSAAAEEAKAKDA
jgi:hypothetical protein